MIKIILSLFIAIPIFAQIGGTISGTVSGTFICTSNCPTGGGSPSSLGVLVGTYATIVGTACNSSNSGQPAQTTDSIYSAVCDGTAWLWFWRGIPVTPPPTSGWTLDAATGSSVTANADGTVTFFFAKRGNASLDAAYQSGSGAQTVTALMCSDYGNVVSGSSDSGSIVGEGFGVRDSSGKYSIFFSTLGTVASPYFFTIDHWASVTSYYNTPDGYPNTYTPPNSTGFAAWQTGSHFIDQDCHWRRVQETSTNDLFSFNTSGSSSNWTQFYGEGVNAYLASGAHSPAVVSYVYGNGNRVVLVSWAVTNP